MAVDTKVAIEKDEDRLRQRLGFINGCAQVHACILLSQLVQGRYG